MKITMLINTDDFKIFGTIVNQGIDSHLEAFTLSNFYPDQKQKGRFVFNFHDKEMPILIRRLQEFIDNPANATYQENAENWLEDIKAMEKEQDAN